MTLPEPINREQGIIFADELLDWILSNFDMARSEINIKSPFPKHFIVKDVESLARDTAHSFQFPNTPDEALRHNSFLHGTSNGHCQFLPVTNKNIIFESDQQVEISVNPILGLAFIPLPVLLNMENPGSDKVCAGALFHLFLKLVALNQFKLEDM